jgi:membrane protease YdiL (CAAX protease family)
MGTDLETRRPLRTAVFSAGLWTLIEVFARRIAGRILGSVTDDELAGDMLITLIELPLSAWIIGRIGTRNGFGPEVWDYHWTPRTVIGGIAAGVVGLASLAVTASLDSTLFDGMDDAEVVDEKTSTAASSLLVGVNGVMVPIIEEFAWRGIIQTALVKRFSPPLGIGVTSIAFAVKHVVVDRSLGRLTTLLTLASILGIVRHRLGIGASTVTHLTANLTASVIAVVSQRSIDDL